MGELAVNDDLQVTYDTYYGSGDIERWRRLGAIDKANNIIQLCGNYPHSTILDIGCGDGAIMERIDELDFGDTYFGLEISISAIEALRRKKIRRLVEAQLFDGYYIPYENKPFTLAILSHVVEHVEFPRQLLYEAGRVAEYVYVEVPLEHTIRLTRDYKPDPVGHINFYTDKTIRRLLQTCGFRVLEQILADDSREKTSFNRTKMKGTLRYLLRGSSLRLLPGVAKHVFVYNSALLCKSPDSKTPLEDPVGTAS